MSTKSYYRADIDGLRAFAVIAVILFHLNVPGIPGGFVGVDIFFVLSGFLITSIILRELDEGTFTFVNFWERRVRRIIPAAIAMVASTFIASYFISLYPIDFKTFGLSIIAQNLFISNLFFMRQVPYFAAPTDTIPLLHTWSLGVEEQFYIIFPILLLLLFTTLKRYLTATLALFAILSFALNVYLTVFVPSQNFTISFLPHIWGGATNASVGFYFLPTRAWELLLGALLATVSIRIVSKNAAHVLSYIGFFGILYSFIFITEEMLFPGYIALLPTISTALLILSLQNSKTFVYQFLSFRPFVLIGLISYALYLWHWPIIVLSKQIWIDDLPSYWNGLVVVLTFILAIMSYFMIETPIRKKYILKTQLSLFTCTGASILILSIAGYVAYTRDGLPQRAPEASRIIAEAATDFNPRREECFKNNIAKVIAGTPPCTLGIQDSDESIDFVLWGDSHADALMPAFDAIAHKNNLYGVFFAVGGCAPLFTEAAITTDIGCRMLKQSAVTFINEHDVNQVFLIANWKSAYTLITENKQISLSTLLEETITNMPTNQKIVLVRAVPLQPKFATRNLFYTASFNKTTFNIHALETTLIEHKKNTASTTVEFASLLKQKNITIFDPADVFCDSVSCALQNSEGILYRDTNHLSSFGALMIKPRIKELLQSEYIEY